MNRFENNLWAELEREHAPALLESVAAQRRLRTRRWISAAAGVVVLGTAAVIAPVASISIFAVSVPVLMGMPGATEMREPMPVSSA